MRDNRYYSDPRYDDARRTSGAGGCVGCAAVLALLAALAVVFIMHMAPPVARNVLESYRLRLLDFLGMYELEATLDTSKLGFAGEQLSEGRQLVYLQLLDGIEQRMESIAVFEATDDDVDPAYHALMRDHPELFWLDGSCVYTYSKVGGVVTVVPGVNVDLEEVPAIQAQIEEVADSFLDSLPEDASEYDIIKATYEYIVNTTDYAADGTSRGQNIQSVFIDHASVCAGYARAYQYLLHRAGQFCAYVEGSIRETGEPHAWNIVRADGTYAHVDVTWGDPTYNTSQDNVASTGIIYDYLGLTTDQITKDQHDLSGEDELPDCSSEDLDYYRREGLLFDGYDEDALAAAFDRQASDGATMAAFKFADDEGYAQAVNALQNGEFLTDSLLQIADQRGESQIHYGYTNNDALRIVKVYW